MKRRQANVSYLTLGTPVSCTAPSFRASQVALPLTRPLLLLAPFSLSTWTLDRVTKRYWGQESSLGPSSCSKERPGEGMRPPPPGAQESSSHSRVGSGKENLQEVSPLPEGPWSASSLTSPGRAPEARPA